MAEKILNNKQREEVKNWAKSTVRDWHDNLNPDYIFLTETSAVLYGHTLKSAWKEAYKNEEIPKFYRIDPGGRGFYRSAYYNNDVSNLSPYEARDYVEKKRLNFFSERIKKKNPKILVFDEGDNKSTSPLTLVYRRKKGRLESYYPPRKTVGLTADLIREYFFEARKTDGSIYCSVHSGIKKPNGDIEINPIRSGNTCKEPDEARMIMNTYRNPTSKLTKRISDRDRSEDEKFLCADGGENYKLNQFTGNIVKHPGQRKRAIAYSHELGDIGKKAGEELREEISKKKSLEKAVRISVFGLFLFSLLIYDRARNVTGFFIKDGSYSFSPFVFLGFFFLLLSFILFFKNRKKK